MTKPKRRKNLEEAKAIEFQVRKLRLLQLEEGMKERGMRMRQRMSWRKLKAAPSLIWLLRSLALLEVLIKMLRHSFLRMMLTTTLLYFRLLL